MQFITILKLIIVIWPLLINTIQLVEDTIPGRGKGEEKLAAVRTFLESSYQVSTDVKVAFDVLWPAIEKTIAGIVTALNAVGIFKK